MPGPHPLPPGDLDARALPVVELEDTWWRISHKKYGPALHFGVSGDCRFDAPDASFGVCYLACDLHGAFIEVFGRSLGRNFVTERALSQRIALEVGATRPLSVVDLTGVGLSKIGADNRLAANDDYGLSQAWSKALHSHPDEVDGVLYRSRHDPERRCLAVFDRCESSLEIRAHAGLSSKSLRRQLVAVVDHYEFEVG